MGREPVPDETTVCELRHLVEAQNLGNRLFGLINEYLAENGLNVRTGTMDVTTIDALSSTKNKDGEPDPEMHLTRKGNQWYFGMKGHICVDRRSKLIHSMVATAANVHDSQLLGELLYGGGDAGVGRLGLRWATRSDPATRAPYQRLHEQERRSQSAVKR